MTDALANLAREYGLRLVVLYGSRARGTAGASSDTDVGILGRRLEWRRRLDLQARLEQVLQLPEVQVVDLERVPPLLRQNVAAGGKPLYEDRPGRFNLFRVEAWRLYLDDAPVRELEKRYLREATERLRG